MCPAMGGHNPLKKLVVSPFHQRGKGVGGTQHLTQPRVLLGGVCWAGVTCPPERSGVGRESGRCLKLTPMPPGPPSRNPRKRRGGRRARDLRP